MEQLQGLRRGIADDDRGALVIDRPVTRAMEAVLARAVRHRAAKMRALAIRRDDAARRVQQEEVALAEQDRCVVRRGERREDLGPRPDVHGHAEADDLADLQERDDRRDELHGGERDRAEEAEPEELSPTDMGLIYITR